MRKLLVVTMAVVGAVALAAPAGLAAKPFQDRFPVGSSFTIPAGYGCPFDVGVVTDGSEMTWEFDNGRYMVDANAYATLTNGDRSVVWHSSPHGVFTTDPLTNEVQADITGRVWIAFYPEDQGPFGQVGGDGAVYGFVGEVTYTADPETGVFESFSAEGVVTDLCAAVAPT